MSRIDTVILGSTLLTSAISFLLFIALNIYKFFKTGTWVKSLTACDVFNVFCNGPIFLKFIGNLEALLFVSLFFGLYYLIHWSLIGKKL